VKDDPEVPPAPQSPADDSEGPRPLPAAVRLFLIPALIVAACLLVIFIYKMLSTGDQSPASYLAEIRTGSEHRRWQAAYELSRVLGQDEAGRDPRVIPEMARLFADSEGRDPRVRRYLALGLGRVGAREAVPALIRALEDPDADTRMYAAWALGAIGDAGAVPPLVGRAGDQDPGMRKVVAYSLGLLHDETARPGLRAMLEDSEPDVRWNAAVALAGFQDDAGRAVLAQMIDRAYLVTIPTMTLEQRDEVVLNGVRGIGKLGGADFEQALAALAARDPSPRVRAAAEEALQRWRSGSPAPAPAGAPGSVPASAVSGRPGTSRDLAGDALDTPVSAGISFGFHALRQS
jgi:hypothetical protein